MCAAFNYHIFAQMHITIIRSLLIAEYKFSMYTPSMIAAASLAAALHGVDWTGKSGYGLAGLLDELTRITAIEQVCVSKKKKKSNSLHKKRKILIGILISLFLSKNCRTICKDAFSRSRKWSTRRGATSRVR